MTPWSTNFIQHAQDLFCVVGFDGHFLQVNPAWEKTLGYTPAEMLSTTLFEIVDSDERELLQRMLATLVNSGKTTASIEIRCRNREGDYHRLSWNMTLDLDERLIYGVARDTSNLELTVRRRTHELQQVNNRVEAILNSSGDAIIMLDESGRVETANRAFRAICRVVPKILTEIIDEPFRQSVADALGEVVETQETLRMEARAAQCDGNLIDVELTLSPVLNNENHIVCTIHDVTHLKAVERIKDQFISTVNHELRNPVAGIVLVADVLHKYYDQQTEEQRRRRIGQIQRQAAALTDLVDAILDVARVAERREEPAGSSIDVSRLVEEMVQNLHSHARQKQQTLALHLPDAPISAEGEYTDISRIWRNLVENALKYTPEGGRIDVRLGLSGTALPPMTNPALQPPPILAALDPGEYLVGQVEDNGHGIDTSDREQLFTRFFRGWAEHSAIPGTGLGLVLVRELLKLYRGGIHVESELGAGTVFTFWIPLRAEEGTVETPAPAMMPPARENGVIETKPVNRAGRPPQNYAVASSGSRPGS